MKKNSELKIEISKAVEAFMDSNQHSDQLIDAIVKIVVGDVGAGTVMTLESNEDLPSSTFLEYNFLSNNYRELLQAEAQCKSILRQKNMEGDIVTMGTLTRIQNDLGLINPLVQAKGFEISHMIEKKYSVAFKFLREEPKQ